MPAVFFAFIAYFGWGISDAFAGLLSRKLDAVSSVFWTFIIRITIYTLLIPFFLKDLQNMTIMVILFILGIGLIEAFSYLSFYEAVRLINPALAGTIALSWGVVSLIISVIFFKERLFPIQLFSVFVIFIGIFLSSFSIEFIKKKKVNRLGLIYAFLTFLGWGLVGALLKFPIQKIGWFWTTYLQVLPFLLIIFIRKLRGKKIVPIRSLSVGLLNLCVAFCILIAELSYNIGLSKGYVSIIAPIAGSYATLMVAISYFVFKDPINKQQKIGIIIGVTGIVLLAFLSR